MQIGLNVSASSRFPVDWLPSFSGGHIRFPLWRGSERLARKRFDSAVAAGCTPLPVLDCRAFTPTQWKYDDDKLAGMRRWASLFPDISVIQVGNEPDQDGDASSTKTAWQTELLIRRARRVWPDATIVAPGLRLDSLSYFQAAEDAGADVLAFNCYGVRPEDLGPAIARIWTVTTLPIWLTEVGAEHGYEGDEHARAAWHSRMLVCARVAGVDAAVIYCGRDDQGPFGLLDGQNEPYETWASVVNAVANFDA